MVTHYDDLPVEQMTQAQFDAIPEYSLSMPTMMTEGKRFKRCIRGGVFIVSRMSKDGDDWLFNWTRPEIVPATAP